MNRRSILLGMGTAAAGAGAVFGSGAFTQVQTERELTIGVDEDSAALLELNASSDVASVANGDNGELVIDTDRLSSESESNSQGFAVGSTVEIGEIDDSDNVPSDGAAFTLTNNFDDVGDGNANLDVGIDLTNIDLSTVSGLTSLEFYGTPSNGDETQVTPTGSRSVFNVGSDEKVNFAIRFTTASTTGPADLDDETVAFQAGSDLTSGDFPTPQPADGVVVRDSDGASFTSIQDAISDGDTGSGETLTVGAGKFNGSVTIDVERLTLEGADGAEPTIDAGGASGTAVGIDAADVRVEGFTVQNFAQNGITIFPGADGAEVVDNTVDTSSVNQSTSFAINTDDGGADNLLIKNNELGYGQTGSLQLNQNSEVTVEGNTISDAQGEATQEIGIVEAGGSNITIIENTISGANARGIKAGAGIPGVTAETNGLSINSNTITNNDVGIVIDTDKVDYSLDNNTFTENRVDTAAI